MRSLLNKLLAMISPSPGRGAGTASPVERTFLTAFGKHPGWADHIADFALPTDRLSMIYKALYTDGIRGNIDSGAWTRLSDDRKLPGFDHVFVWRFAHETIVGMIWPSSDQVGRSEYPMIACAQVEEFPSTERLRNVVGVLSDIRGQCTSTTSADAVRNIIGHGQARLRSAAGEFESGTPTEPDPLATLAACPAMGPELRGLRFVLYQIEREMGLYRSKPGQDGAAFTKTITARPQQFRAPACADSQAEAASLWIRFMLTQVDRRTAILALVPAGCPWIDVLVGWPGITQLFCMRASPKQIPPTTEIPYEPPAEFNQRMDQLLAPFARS